MFRSERWISSLMIVAVLLAATGAAFPPPATAGHCAPSSCHDASASCGSVQSASGCCDVAVCADADPATSVAAPAVAPSPGAAVHLASDWGVPGHHTSPGGLAAAAYSPPPRERLNLLAILLI